MSLKFAPADTNSLNVTIYESGATVLHELLRYASRNMAKVENRKPVEAKALWFGLAP